MDVGELKNLLEILPNDMPVTVMDDGFPHPLQWGVVRQWKLDECGWPVSDHEPEPDDEPGDHEGFVPALILSAEDYEPGGIE